MIYCENLDEAIARYAKLGYRLDMITPADSPREVQLSKNEETVRLVARSNPTQAAPASGDFQNDWVTGRAGMEYRDLIPDRLGGKLIASHIRLTQGGPVPDYVHYHTIDFQLIYCMCGQIRVVYEGQGEPFWLEPGDCVLQPPKIRHRVLECEAGSEVLELSSPAEHETWVEHEVTLPTADRPPNTLFGGQRFARSVAKEATWKATETAGVDARDLGVYEATNGLIDVRVRRSKDADLITAFNPKPGMTAIGFIVAGREKKSVDAQQTVPIHRTNDNFMTEILWLELRDELARP